MKAFHASTNDKSNHSSAGLGVGASGNVGAFNAGNTLVGQNRRKTGSPFVTIVFITANTNMRSASPPLDGTMPRASNYIRYLSREETP